MDPTIQLIVQRDWFNVSTRNVLRFPKRVFSTLWMTAARTTAPIHVHGLALKRPQPYRSASPTDSAVPTRSVAAPDRPSGRLLVTALLPPNQPKCSCCSSLTPPTRTNPWSQARPPA